MGNSVYLSGPSNTPDPSVPISTDWKAYAASTFLKSGMIVANPLELDLTGFIDGAENEEHSSVKHSLSLIDKSDSILANINQLTESATMEMFYAHRQGKQVVVVGNEPFSPWILSHCEARFQKLKEALDYLVDQPSKLDTLTWSTQFENDLSKKSEKYPEPGEADFEYYGGNLPVLILAPHSTSYFKDGELFPPETYTGTIAALLHKITGCHSLITSHCTAADPISYLNSPLPNFLTSLLDKMKFKLILVLRGSNEWSSPYDITLTSWNKSSLIDKAEYLNLLMSTLKVKGFKDIGFDSPSVMGADSKTISHLVFEDFSTPTINIDIHKRYRLPHMQPSLFTDFNTAIAQFLMLVGV